MPLTNKRILLGITGGIAVYKSADLVRRLREAGAEVRVAMTAAAQAFVTPLTFQALSGHPVLVDWEQPESDFAMDHIAQARWADLILIAPATADFMAKLAHGFANDVLSTLCLASEAPIALAPAMNQQMWANSATQFNKQQLLDRGFYLLGPAEGNQACGEVGLGRVLEPLEIIAAISESIFPTDTLKGIRILVTAGPTQEPIDPIRFMSNHSSGKMGYALAVAASNLGAEVTLVSGPTHLDSPSGVQRICVTTAQQMYHVVMTHVQDCQIFIAAAAVADYHFPDVPSQKIKKDQEILTLNLVKNPDILSAVAHSKNPPFTVGFAAETENLFQNARIKLEQKNLDMIAANDVSNIDAGFNSENNALTVLWKQGEKEFSLRSKKQLAKDFLDLVVQLYRDKNSGFDT